MSLTLIHGAPIAKPTSLADGPAEQDRLLCLLVFGDDLPLRAGRARG